jgi:hypothetical protein
MPPTMGVSFSRPAVMLVLENGNHDIRRKYDANWGQKRSSLFSLRPLSDVVVGTPRPRIYFSRE